MRKRKTDWRFFKKLRVRSVAPWIVDFNGFLISMDGFFEGCSIASKIPMDDQNSLKFTFSMDFFETVFFRGFFHRERYAIPHITQNVTATCQHHPLRKKPLRRRSSKECSSRFYWRQWLQIMADDDFLTGSEGSFYQKYCRKIPTFVFNYIYCCSSSECFNLAHTDWSSSIRIAGICAPSRALSQLSKYG